jgi:hypothetical protein
MRRSLVALLAPGSVEAEVGRVQQRIFHDHGFVSSVALPPLVPVAFLAGEPPAAQDQDQDQDQERVHRDLLARLNAAVSAPYRVMLAGAQWCDGWLYLRVDSGGVWGALRAAAAANEAPGWFPASEGFFLGCREAGVEQRGLIQPLLPSGGFTSSRLAVVLLDTAEEENVWWRRVSMEILDEIPLRGRRS